MDLEKPARLQVDPEQIPDDDKPPQTGHTFNVWYLQWAGGDPTARAQTKLKFRLNVANDSGYTRAKDGRSAICLFYARGCCFRGKECLYLHRPPRPEDVRMHTQDCFGRDKTADYKDDMSGVGLLARTNRTLYVGGIIPNDQVHDQISKQFLEYGAIDQIKVLPAKKCAFVRFRLEAEAQFAKEAMDTQSLGEKDILSVKWANEDMSQEAQRLAAVTAEALAIETVKRLLGDDSATPINTKKQKKQSKKEKQSNKHIAGDKEEIDKKGIDVEDAPADELYHGSSAASTQASGGLIDESRLQALRKAVGRAALAKNEMKHSSAVKNSGVDKMTAPLNFLSGYSSGEE